MSISENELDDLCEKYYHLGRNEGKQIAYYAIIETNDYEEFMSFCYEADEKSREYTPFEFLAKEINDYAAIEDWIPSELWDHYDAGLYDGFREVWQTTKD